AIKGTTSGKDVVERLVPVMAEGPPRVQAALIDAHATLPAEGFGHAFTAARRSRTPAEVFVLFSPYLSASVDEKKKHRDPAWMKRETIVAEFIGRTRWRRPEEDDSSFFAQIDPRWLDLAIKVGRADLVQAIAMPGHAGAHKFLSEL